MPFVRYARDRRGYETLYVMHAFEGSEGHPGSRAARVRVLYACRTVPYAKVGRMTIDESVQRRLETAYPKLTFDWPKLLKEAAQSAPRPERTMEQKLEMRRGRGGRKKEGRAQAPQVPRVPQVPQVPVVPEVRFEVPQVRVPDADVAPETEAADAPEPLEPITELIDWTPLAAEPEPEPEPEPRTEPVEPAEPVEPMEPAEPWEPVVGSLEIDRSWPVVEIVGPDRAMLLRGRYIELASKVLSRVHEPAARRRLFAEAARLNPGGWTTAEAAQAGVASFETAYARLAEQLRQTPPL